MRITVAAHVAERTGLSSGSAVRWRAGVSLSTVTFIAKASTRELAVKHLRKSLERQFAFLAAEGWLEDFASRHYLPFDAEPHLPEPLHQDCLVVAITEHESATAALRAPKARGAGEELDEQE